MIKHRCDSAKEMRIDRYLNGKELEGFFSRSQIEKLLSNGSIMVNGEVVKKSFLVKQGDLIEYELPQPEPQGIAGEAIPLNVVYEDEYLAVINKQPGISVHPGAGIRSGTLVNALVHHFGQSLSHGWEANRPGIVHRLDKDTSGLLVIARNDMIQSKLSQQFQERTVHKKYLAIAVGVPAPESGEIKTFIARSRNDRRRMCVSNEGKEAYSIYRVLENYEYFSLVEVELKTGRTHQIRVHLDHIGCPLLGDELYNSAKRTINSLPVQYRKRVEYLVNKHTPRQALHSWQLGFKHPVSGKSMQFEADLPADIAGARDYLRNMQKIFY